MSLVRASCEDGSDFIRNVVGWAYTDPIAPYTGPPRSVNRIQKARRAGRPIEAPSRPPRRRIDHFVMNLPDSAITFLDAFRGLLSSGIEEDLRALYDKMPMVHCHCFTREMELGGAEYDIRQVTAPMTSCIRGTNS